jgi:hypothetical protein
MLRRRRTRDQVVALCNEVAGFLGRMEAREAEGFYLHHAEALRVELGGRGHGRHIRCHA